MSTETLFVYFADFTNFLRQQDVKKLAEADEHEVVKEIQVRSEPVFLHLLTVYIGSVCRLYCCQSPPVFSQLAYVQSGERKRKRFLLFNIGTLCLHLAGWTVG